MKNNTRFWLFIIFISTFVIILNNLNLNRIKPKKYTFSRNFSKFKFKISDTVSFNNKILINDSLILHYLNKNNKIVFSIVDLSNNSSIITSKLDNKQNGFVTSFNSNFLYLIDKFTLLKISTTNNKYISNKNTLQTIKAYSLDNDDNILVFGEIEKNNQYFTGFYVLNYNSNKILSSKEIQHNSKTKKIENILIYSGNFTSSNNYITYTCNNNPYIYIFDKNGKYIKTLITSDKTPLPELISDEQGIYYKRDKTFNTNNCSFIRDKILYVFSSRTNKNFIVIDAYSIDNNQYLRSYKLNYNNHISTDINHIAVIRDKLYLFFNNEYIVVPFLE